MIAGDVMARAFHEAAMLPGRTDTMQERSLGIHRYIPIGESPALASKLLVKSVLLKYAYFQNGFTSQVQHNRPHTATNTTQHRFGLLILQQPSPLMLYPPTAHIDLARPAVANLT
jgi:hypothetical protein